MSRTRSSTTPAARPRRVSRLIEPAEVERQHGRGIESEIERRQPHEALPRKCAGHEQGHGDRHLDDDEDTACVRAHPASRVSHRKRVHRRDHGGPLRLQCRSQANAERHRGGDQQTGGEDDGVHPRVRQAHDRRRAQRNQPSKRQGGDTDADESPRRREHACLDQALPHQLPRRRTQRSPDGNFARAKRVTCDQESRDIRAGDDEHERDRAHEQPQRPAGSSEDVIEERSDRDLCGGIRRCVRELPAAGRIHLHLRRRYARLQPGEHMEGSHGIEDLFECGR